MTLITDTATLADFCRRLGTAPYVTVDTEFIRERTYWPRLCLIQLGGPEAAAAVDPLAEGLDLAPIFELFADETVLKVLHAGRQDMEIFHAHAGTLPRPVFDTQIAAMVCGFGENVGYERLVNEIAGAELDKAASMTDWARRPLSERQIAYALSDVTHLRPIYEHLAGELEHSGRGHWLDAEMAVLTDPATYETDPEAAWQRVKSRNVKPKALPVLKDLAAWREREAQRRDLPRGWILKDAQIVEIASQRPQTAKELSRTRGLSQKQAEGSMGRKILDVVVRAAAKPPDKSLAGGGRGPRVTDEARQIADLLKVLLKHKSALHDVAPKMIAGSDELLAIAMDDDADVPALAGWRREIFGADALKLKRGEIALGASSQGLVVAPWGGDQDGSGGGDPGGGTDGAAR